jgi:hypothetical protein
MIIDIPIKNTYTIYYVDNHIDSIKAMKLVEKFVIFPLFINCTNYMKENKYEFFNKIENYVHFSYKSFPIVFFNKKLIGSYTELLLFYEKNKQTYYELSSSDQSILHLSPPPFHINIHNKNNRNVRFAYPSIDICYILQSLYKLFCCIR